jgi:hypothetical protein
MYNLNPDVFMDKLMPAAANDKPPAGSIDFSQTARLKVDKDL